MPQEFRRKWEDAIFAGTPPLEALRILIALAAKGIDDPDPTCMLLLDIKKAHFYAPCKQRKFVRLPPEDPKSLDPEICGELKFSMYGTRDAASNWEDAYTSFLEGLGYVRGRSSPCVFYSKEDNVRFPCGRPKKCGKWHLRAPPQNHVWHTGCR